MRLRQLGWVALCVITIPNPKTLNLIKKIQFWKMISLQVHSFHWNNFDSKIVYAKDKTG